MSGYGAFVQTYYNEKTGYGKRTIFTCNKCQFKTISVIKIMIHMKNGHPIPLTKFFGDKNDNKVRRNNISKYKPCIISQIP